MTFLNPLLLLGLLGMGVPLVIHLLSRRTARKLDFSSLEFLRRLERKSMRRVRVRQLLLLLARMLLIAAVSLAMARPTLTGLRPGEGRGSTSAALVLDASYSMGARGENGPIFDEAKAAMLRILETFEDGDEVVLLVPGALGEAGTEPVRDLGLVRERIDAARPGLGAVSLEAALRDAARALDGARHPNREIHVVSDFQRTAWERLGEGQALPEGMGLFLFPVGEDVPANSWVESVDHAGQILERGSPIEFRAVVASGPGFGPKEVEVEMEVDGRVADVRRIDLGPSSRVALTFRETFAEDGVHLGRIAIRGGDVLAEDDRRNFTLRTARDVPVMLVAGSPESGRYLASALAPAGATAGSFAVRTAEARELASASRDREAVVVVADVERVGEEELAGLKAFLSDGGGLLVFPGPKLDAAAWGRSFFPKFLPGRLSDLRSAPDAVTIASFDPSHPLFDVFRDGEGGIGDVRFTRTLEFRPEAGTAVLASYSSGDPAILESALLPGRVLFFTSALDPAWSDLPLTGAFVPLLHESVRYLSETSTKTAHEIEIGEGATVWLPGVPEGGSVTLRSPDGETRVLGLEPGPRGYGLELPEADAPGFWTFESSAHETLAALAASIPSRESDPERVPATTIRDLLEGVRGAVLASGEGLAHEVREARLGREIGRFFLWAAALFLAAEMVLAARLRGPLDESADS
jgi:hypothetical protein